MILFPAIDLKNGDCVRLERGDMAKATIFNNDPGAQAKSFEDSGFEYLHVVDLDGAFAGESRNGTAVERILKSVSIPVQLGGGIRNLSHIEAWLSKGLARVILGTVAVRDPALVKQACREFPNQVAVGIDAHDGYVAVEGWAEKSEITILDLASEFVDCGVAAIIYTDIARDGVLKGLNFKATLELANNVPIPVIASGGLASMKDIARLCEPDCANLAGAITGRALYDGRLDAQEALALIARSGKSADA